MKLMKKLVCLALVAMMTLSLVACGGSDIVGEWTMEENGITTTYKFEDDGKGSVGASGFTMDFEYETDGDEITLKISFMGATEESKGTFEIDGDTLKLTIDGETQELTRK